MSVQYQRQSRCAALWVPQEPWARRGRGGYRGVAPGPLPGGGLGRAPAGAARARDQGRVECEGWRCVACVRLVSV